VGETARTGLPIPPAWETVTVWPATITIPVRDWALLLAAIVRPTLPEPVPELPEGTVIQPTLLVALHGQTSWVFTETLLRPPLAATLSWVVVTT
jgi:hypothetical protein